MSFSLASASCSWESIPVSAQPELVALVGVTLFRALFPAAAFRGLGLHTERLGHAEVFVLPNPSGRNANFSYEEMLDAFRALRAELR
jgi:TDG/mug DNA glycosylase family protein